MSPRLRPSAAATLAALVCGVVLTGVTAGTRAQQPTGEESADAYFERGMAHQAADELGEALEAFRRAYELSRDPELLYYVGVVEGRLFLYVEARRSLRRFLAQATTASAVLRARAEGLVATIEANRVGFLAITSQPEGASITLDGRELGETPLEEPVAVAPGAHVVMAELADHEGTRAEVTTAVGRTEHVDVRLERIERPRLALAVRPSGASVFLDGELVGESPFGSPFSMTPGEHAIEVTREGFRTVRRRVELAPGARERLAVRLQPLPARLVVRSSPTSSSLRVDGRLVQLDPHGALVVPAGRHRLVARAPGHAELTLELTLAPGERRALDLRLRRPGLLERPLFWVVTGAVVLGGATAGYFLLRPDGDRTTVAAPAVGAR